MNCLEYALYYINRYPKTAFELRLQLRKKKYTDDDIDAAMTVLEEKNYVNDYEFAKLYYSSEVARKWKPVYMVTQKLRQKWVSQDILDELQHHLRDDLQEGVYSKLDREMDKLKAKWHTWFDIIRKLQTRGYSLRDIKTVIARREDDA